MQDNKQFSLRARVKSFSYAFNGFFYFLRTEHNAIIHLLATAIVITSCILLSVSGIEAAALVIVTGLVWMAELFNTAIEKTMDFISMEKKQEIKFIKDLSAAAVLLASFIAIAVGCIIFIPKIF
jgi:diacylglycerol kinase (ATP)